MRLVLRTIRYLSDNRCFAMTWKLGSFRGNFQTLRTGSTRCITGPTTHSEEVEQVERPSPTSASSPPRSAGRSLTFSSPLISVHGFMEANTYHSVLNISVVPRRWPCHNVTMWQCDLVTMWQYDPVTSPDKFAWAKHWHLSPSLCYLRYIYLLFFLPSIACRHLSSVPEHPWASPIKKLSFFIQRTSGDIMHNAYYVF